MNAVNEITGELKGMESMLADVPRTMPYSVPDGYFDQLPAAIQAAVNAAEVAAQYAVPDGYFDNFPQQVLAAAKKADRKPLLLALGARIRWVAAAVLIICIGAGSYMTFTLRPLSTAERLLASVPASEIQDYLQSERVDGGTAPGTVSNLQLDNKEIVRYLNETGWE